MSDKIKEEVIDFSKKTPPTSTLKVQESLISVDEVKPHISNEKKMQAQIRMVVETTYPESQVGNSRNESIFGAEDFDFGDGETYQEGRVTWIDVPLGSTMENVQAKMDSEFTSARIYRVLSLKPTLTDEQIRAMESGFSTYANEDGVEIPIDMDFYRRKQRIPVVEDGEAVEGEFIDYKGLPQYRMLYFSKDGTKDDIDSRPEEYAAYMNEESFQLDEEPTKAQVVSRMRPRV